MGLVDDRGATRAAMVLLQADAVSEGAAARAGALDHHGAFPSEDVEALRVAGLLTAPLPVSLGGAGLCAPESINALRATLTAIGRGSLPLGRLYEGHVNALALVLRYGSSETCERLARDAGDGHFFGVWNTEPNPGGLAIRDGMLAGAKSFASGSGSVTRPLVTAETADGRRQMLVVPLERGERSDLSSWRSHGMRASATGHLDFAGIPLADAVLVGEPDDYFRQPFFAGGSWRSSSVESKRFWRSTGRICAPPAGAPIPIRRPASAEPPPRRRPRACSWSEQPSSRSPTGSRRIVWCPTSISHGARWNGLASTCWNWRSARSGCRVSRKPIRWNG